MRALEQVFRLPCHPSSVTRARHVVRDLLEEWDLAALGEDAQLGTSELVANAVRHARTELLLTVRSAEAVTISIRDGDPQLRRPVTGEADTLAESGRGLHIVAAISRDWGITATEGGKTIWFTLARPDDGRSDADVLNIKRSRPEWSYPADDSSDVDGISVRSGLHEAV
jgi:anti-sigma regulatory factor (Ser/Thr protein kinase)